MEAQASAKVLRKRLGLRGWINIDDVARTLGFRVEERLFLGTKIREITADNGIAFDARLGSRERRWVIAHGIGHTILHNPHMNHIWLSLRNEPLDRYEREAEIFAYNFLVCHEQAMHKALGENLDLATYYGIPVSKMTLFGGFA